MLGHWCAGSSGVEVVGRLEHERVRDPRVTLESLDDRTPLENSLLRLASAMSVVVAEELVVDAYRSVAGGDNRIVAL